MERLEVLLVQGLCNLLTLAIRFSFSFSYVLLRLKGFIPTVTPAPYGRFIEDDAFSLYIDQYICCTQIDSNF